MLKSYSNFLVTYLVTVFENAQKYLYQRIGAPRSECRSDGRSGALQIESERAWSGAPDFAGVLEMTFLEKNSQSQSSILQNQRW